MNLLAAYDGTGDLTINDMTSQTGIKTEDIISTLQYLDMIKVSSIVCSGVENDLAVNLSVSLLGLERPARNLCETGQYRRKCRKKK